MGKHTQGNWATDLVIEDDYNISVRSNEWYVASATGGIDPEEQKANAKLIAAAPDLLEAVSIAHSHLTNPMSVQMSKEQLAKMLLDAIKKATQ